MKCEHERICDNCKLGGSRDCCGCFNGLDHRKFSCKICKENKPLTIAELEQMDGEPVWLVIPLIKTNKSEWVLANVAVGGVYDNEGEIYYFSNFNNDKICCYKEKPSPRMVTIEIAIEEKLTIRYLRTDEFKPALECLQFAVNKYGLPNEAWVMACWEAKG